MSPEGSARPIGDAYGLSTEPTSPFTNSAAAREIDGGGKRKACLLYLELRLHRRSRGSVELSQTFLCCLWLSEVTDRLLCCPRQHRRRRVVSQEAASSRSNYSISCEYPSNYMLTCECAAISTKKIYQNGSRRCRLPGQARRAGRAIRRFVPLSHLTTRLSRNFIPR